MLKYILKRLLIFVPTLFAISLLTFVISINAPGDPVDSMLNKGGGGEGQVSQKLATEKAYNNLRHQLGLDLPVFYFSFTNATLSDTLHRVPKANHRANLERLSFENGNWGDVSEYYKDLNVFENDVFSITKTEENAAALRRIKDYIASLYDSYDPKKIGVVFSQLDHIFTTTPSVHAARPSYTAAKNAYHSMIHGRSPYRKYIPSVHFHGTQNQYHRWMLEFLTRIKDQFLQCFGML
jgi:peptide/nickel transport system permease protein